VSRSWREALVAYARPRVAAMVGLGFSAGLPYLLVFSTLTAWLSEAGVSRPAIGAFAWVGVTYSIKVFWAPFVDRLPLPILTRRLGRRRSWMLVAQLAIAAGLFVIAHLDPTRQLPLLAGVALAVAFASATQDVAVDAWRIEAEDADFQGVLAAVYVTGYRLAMLAAGAGALWLAELQSWRVAYSAMAVLGFVGVATTLFAPEPDAPPREALPSGVAGALVWFRGAVVGPLADFVRRHGRSAATILALVALYKIPDVVMAGMANPFLLEAGYSKGQIASVAKVLGFGATLAGAGLGGVVVARLGVLRSLLPGLLALAASNLAFAALALHGGADLTALGLAVATDSAAGGFASAVFIAWLSSLTSPGHSATQYALLSSLMTLPAKLLAGFAGAAVDALGWPLFFTGTAALGLPALALVVQRIRAEPSAPTSPTSAAASVPP
jgi:PAT family beta-lactamase induction signal transducer AmpG